MEDESMARLKKETASIEAKVGAILTSVIIWYLTALEKNMTCPYRANFRLIYVELKRKTSQTRSRLLQRWFCMNTLLPLVVREKGKCWVILRFDWRTCLSASTIHLDGNIWRSSLQDNGKISRDLGHVEQKVDSGCLQSHTICKKDQDIPWESEEDPSRSRGKGRLLRIQIVFSKN